MRPLLLGLLLSLPAAAQERIPFEINLGKFCGIDESNSSTLINDCDSPDAENVITDEGGVKRMFGMEVMVSSALSGFPIRNHAQFIASNGVKYLVFHASAAVYYTDLSASPVKLKDVDSSSEVDMCPAFNKIIFVNRTETAWYWDGTSTAAISGMPLASYCEFKDERIYIGDTATSNSQVAVSSFGSLTYWTVPSDLVDQPEAPNSFTFNRDDGCAIKCVKATTWGLFVGKECSTHILKGVDNDTYFKRIVHPQVGCIDDRLVQVDDRGVIWLAKDGVYAWDGSAGIPKLISRKIEDRVRSIRQAVSNVDSWLMNTASDWDSGHFFKDGPTPGWNSTTIEGSIIPSSITRVDTSTADFNAGVAVNVSSGTADLLKMALATTTIKGGTQDDDALWVCAGSGDASKTCAASFDNGVGNCAEISYSVFGSINDAWYFEVLNAGDLSVLATATAGSTSEEHTYIDTSVVTSSAVIIKVKGRAASGADGNYCYNKDPFWTGVTVQFDHWADNGGGNQLIQFDNVKVTSYPPTGTFTSRTFDTAFSSPLAGPFLVGFSSSITGAGAVTFQYQTSADGSSWDTAATATPNIVIGGKKRYLRWIANYTTNRGTATAIINDVTLTAVSTGTYYSPVMFIGSDITSWRTGDFETTETPSGRVTFEYRAAGSIFTVLSSTPAWTTHTNHQLITTSTGSYVQFRVTANLHSSTETLVVARALTNWREGEAPPGASLVHDHRYIMCVNVSTAATANDSCEIYQRNNEWTRLTGKSIGSLALYDGDPTAGSGQSDSTIWRIMRRGVYNYGGSAINSYWKTKDFSVDRIHSDKTLRELWVDAEAESGSSIDVGYTVNRATSTVTETVELDTETDYVNERVPFDQGFARGRYLRFKLSNTDLDEFFKVNVLSIFGDIEPRY